ncbi:MAG: hypothetical protein SGILL_002783 [Bacillariaceae sp.]
MEAKPAIDREVPPPPKSESVTKTTTSQSSSSMIIKQQGLEKGQLELDESPNAADDRECKENKSTVKVKPKSPIRKRLGCRREEDDLITSDDEDEVDTALQRKLFFTSPRLVESDESLFPANHSPYKKSDERWRQISNQAGKHRQDGTVITIGRKITPMALRIGMTKQAAGRVRALNLWLDHDKDTLPEWLDVIANTFTNLEHLALTEDVFPGEDEMAVSSRMRRLYVLYRLPYLKSIDDQIVSSEERRLARPNESDPNGDKVIRSQFSSLLEDNNHSRNILEEDDDDGCSVDSPPAPSQKQQHLAHELPVETINDKFSHGVINDGHFGHEYDALARIPRIPALQSTMSNFSTKTATEVGVEINQELAQKFAELNRDPTATTMSESTGLDFDEILDDELAGVAMLSDLAASSEEVEAFEKRDHDDLSTSISGDDTNELFPIASSESETAIENVWQTEAADLDASGQIKQCSYNALTIENLEGKKKGVRSQVVDSEDNSIELISVASTDLEWTAACGVLSFRSDRSCAPRLRMPFSRNRKVSAADADAAVRAIRQAKINLRNKQHKKDTNNGEPCTPVLRNDDVATPQVGCCVFGSAQKPKFFGDRGANNTTSTTVSANKQLPPSKSLSSPFPMQFRERQMTPPRTQLVVKTSESTESSKSRESMETISSPLQAVKSVSSSSPKSRDQKKLKAGKGDLPPTCPTASRRKVPIPGPKARKSKRRQLQMRKSKQNARSTSVMDLEDDEDEADFTDDEILLSRSSDDDDEC